MSRREADRRSPYIVLGVRFGATKDEAQRAFARATRRVRRDGDVPFDAEDLNWALHAIEQRIEDPATSIDDYRMPANPEAYEIPSGGTRHSAGDQSIELALRRELRNRIVSAALGRADVSDPSLPEITIFIEED